MGSTRIFHVGSPLIDEPHKDWHRVARFHEMNPGARCVFILKTQEEVDAIKPMMTDLDTALVWDDDEKMQNWLMQRLVDVTGAYVLQPQWFACPEKHITPFNYGEDYSKEFPKCAKCDGGVAIVQPVFEAWKAFAELFHEVVKLANFDTRSGVYLHAAVDPMSNLCRNLVEYGARKANAREIDAKDVRGVSKGKAAILIAAGPSLDSQIDEIKRLSDKVTVCCVGRVYKKLRAAGVRVDYVFSVEMFDWDAAIFTGMEADPHTILCYASVCAPATVAAWKGKSCMMLDIETALKLKRDDWIYGGNSVSHHMLNFACQILDADECILVGQDLAYTKPGVTHAAASEADWPEEVKAIDATPHEQLVWVACTGMGGDMYEECHRAQCETPAGGPRVTQFQVLSSSAYENFATLMSMLIAKHGKKVRNACGNGQFISRTEYVDLAKL